MPQLGQIFSAGHHKPGCFAQPLRADGRQRRPAVGLDDVDQFRQKREIFVRGLRRGRHGVSPGGSGARPAHQPPADRRGGRAGAFQVIDATRICSITANLGDTKTTITHPASTSHGRLSEEQRLAAGIVQGMVRLAVGLDDVEDLKADLLLGLSQL